jgi:hypothetical protein
MHACIDIYIYILIYVCVYHVRAVYHFACHLGLIDPRVAGHNSLCHLLLSLLSLTHSPTITLITLLPLRTLLLHATRHDSSHLVPCC